MVHRGRPGQASPLRLEHQVGQQRASRRRWRQAPVRLGDGVDRAQRRRRGARDARAAPGDPRSSAMRVAVNMCQRREPEAQVVGAKATLLALELRFEVSLGRARAAPRRGPRRASRAPPRPAPRTRGATAPSRPSTISAATSPRGRRAVEPLGHRAPRARRARQRVVAHEHPGAREGCRAPPRRRLARAGRVHSVGDQHRPPGRPRPGAQRHLHAARRYRVQRRTPTPRSSAGRPCAAGAPRVT